MTVKQTIVGGLRTPFLFRLSDSVLKKFCIRNINHLVPKLFSKKCLVAILAKMTSFTRKNFDLSRV